MIAACATHIPLPSIPAHVVVVRARRRLSASPPGRPPTTRTTTTSSTTTTTSSTTTTTAGRPAAIFLQSGDQIAVAPHGSLFFSLYGSRYRILHGHARLGCRGLALGARGKS